MVLSRSGLEMTFYHNSIMVLHDIGSRNLKNTLTNERVFFFFGKAKGGIPRQSRDEYVSVLMRPYIQEKFPMEKHNNPREFYKRLH